MKLLIKEKYNQIKDIYLNVQNRITINQNLLTNYKIYQNNNITNTCKQNLDQTQKDYNDQKKLITNQSLQKKENIANAYKNAQKNSKEHYEQTKKQIEDEYANELLYIKEQFKEMSEMYPGEYLPWHDKFWRNFTPPTELKPPLTRMGEMTISYNNQSIKIPALLRIITSNNVLFQASGHTKETALSAIQSIVLRLLVTIPPGKLKLLIFDPTGLGSNMPGFKHLPEEIIIGDKIWGNKSEEIELQMNDLSKHIENIVQTYLLNTHSSIEVYNNQAGDFTVAYRLLIIVDFPDKFDEETVKTLLRIAKIGPKRGVYVIILQDTDIKLPYNFDIKDLESLATIINCNGKKILWHDNELINNPLGLDQLPANDLFNPLVNSISEKSELTQELPFDLGFKNLDDYWCLGSGELVSIPIGRTPKKDIQLFSIGEDTRQHVFIGGQTGGGKSNLLHVIIMSLCLNYSPEELELYLIDCKYVEFSKYINSYLPHATVIAAHSKREFLLSVLKHLENELTKRTKIFGEHNVEKISEFRQKFPDHPMPRIFLLIDEYQEIFRFDDHISGDCNMIFNKLVSLGRAFGIHVILVTQKLTLKTYFDHDIIDQMAVRIVLKTTDPGKLLSDNEGHKHLEKKGEAIYNDNNGLEVGNTFFQIFFLENSDRDKYLQIISQKTKSFHKKIEKIQIIVDGEKAASIDFNSKLKQYIENKGLINEKHVPAKHWLGEKITIGPPLHAIFKRQTQSNLLILGKKEEAPTNIIISSIISMATQVKPDDVEIFLILKKYENENENGYNKRLQTIDQLIPHKINKFSFVQIEDAIQNIQTIFETRYENSDELSKHIFIYIIGVHNAKKLQSSDGYSYPEHSEKLQRIIAEGPDYGIHTICWSNTLKNLEKSLDRKILSEFDMRIASFKLGRDESDHLLDSNEAETLESGYALFYDEEKIDKVEKFEPYATPSDKWIDDVKHHLANKY